MGGICPCCCPGGMYVDDDIDKVLGESIFASDIPDELPKIWLDDSDPEEGKRLKKLHKEHDPTIVRLNADKDAKGHEHWVGGNNTLKESIKFSRLHAPGEDDEEEEEDDEIVEGDAFPGVGSRLMAPGEIHNEDDKSLEGV